MSMNAESMTYNIVGLSDFLEQSYNSRRQIIAKITSGALSDAKLHLTKGTDVLRYDGKLSPAQVKAIQDKINEPVGTRATSVGKSTGCLLDMVTASESEIDDLIDLLQSPKLVGRLSDANATKIRRILSAALATELPPDIGRQREERDDVYAKYVTAIEKREAVESLVASFQTLGLEPSIWTATIREVDQTALEAANQAEDALSDYRQKWSQSRDGSTLGYRETEVATFRAILGFGKNSENQ